MAYFRGVFPRWLPHWDLLRFLLLLIYRLGSRRLRSGRPRCCSQKSYSDRWHCFCLRGSCRHYFQKVLTKILRHVHQPWSWEELLLIWLTHIVLYLTQSKVKNHKENSQEEKCSNAERHAIFIYEFEFKSNRSLQFPIINASLVADFQRYAP